MTAPSRADAAQTRAGSGAELVLRLLVAAALAVDAVVHLRLADAMQLAAPGGIGGGTLFRLQAVAAIVVGLWLLVRGSRWAYLAAALVLASVLAAVLLYSYVDVPPVGPIPRMYDPLWGTTKLVSTVVEGLGAVLAVIGAVITRRRGR
ncbi:hypothetical protein [Ornithinicoccus halotolerans]|uniref:hypothetical protein n=1 Tax=Ornithinicoccus halotolerans TaxID=1748220 RepID=UPI001E5F19A0|nr:hypothetical protein [Ornithinicoccus halotolerans]